MRYFQWGICWGIIFLWAPLYADLIDFENNSADIVSPNTFVDTAPLSQVTTVSNVVTFQVGHSAPDISAFVAQVGNPITGFSPGDNPAGGNPGEFFLSDDDGIDNFQAFDYFIEFANPVLNLSLDFYDLHGPDVTLRVFSDRARTVQVGSDIAFETGQDASVLHLSVTNPSAPILAAVVDYNNSTSGSGIDNVAFTTANPIPEPTSLSLLLCALLSVPKMLRQK